MLCILPISSMISIALIILNEKYKLGNSLYTFVHPPTPSSIQPY
jgi:hypothetical protein